MRCKDQGRRVSRSPLAWMLALIAAAASLSACASQEIDPDRPPLYDYEPPPLDDTPGSVVPNRI